MRVSAPYSFRDDPKVPDFEAGERFTVMDAHCALCAHGARWIARNDRSQEFRIVPMQSALGRALMQHYGLDPDDPASWLFVDKGRAYTSLDAFIRVGACFGGIWHGLAVLRVLPRGLQDAAYGVVARNRIRVFGRADLCAMPDPAVQTRLVR